MHTFSHKEEPAGTHIVEIRNDKGDVIYSTDGFASRELAERDARVWHEWANAVPQGTADSIYYILAMPITWFGPPPKAHRYSGLHFKIGRTNNVLKRLQDLRTGTSDDLIIHAMEQSSAAIEAERHKRFSSDRRQGEWFAASPQLCQHAFQTWRKNRVLPPEHQQKILAFFERGEIYASLKSSGAAFDMINPSLNEPWFGSVFLDLVHTPLARSNERDG